MLRDIQNAHPKVEAVVDVILEAQADILVLQDIDFDAQWIGLKALNEKLRDQALVYKHIFTAMPNAGHPTGLDIDQDGRLAEPEDAQSYGAFPGQGGIAVLSRYEITEEDIENLTQMLWAEAENHMHLSIAFKDILPEGAESIYRLSARSHLRVPIQVGENTIELLTHHATAPVFDGPKDRNGWRNAAENLFWENALTRDKHQIYIANTNLDPEHGDGRRDIMQKILHHPILQDPFVGLKNTHTVTWESTGPMRVSYVLPARHLTVVNAGTIGGLPLQSTNEMESRHRLVWVDIQTP